ncbi:hypothetical protein HPT29_010415 [Microvirga terrae]|uniref:DUF6894 domain-containing protein n=1 Tax=Microvirga terrae TaxID=2740529 RepID=A0ABY5RW61_9HYPH|nr:hypothetical protein [Microvirga terrae]UVF21495.1 hypothetical protein HPT29_010415 [Microvirga terrae]
MPRYHLNVHDELNPAPAWTSAGLETLAAAEREAARTAAAIGLHKLPNDGVCQAVVEVSDEHHQRVAVMTVSMRIDRPISPPRTFSPWAA